MLGTKARRATWSVLDALFFFFQSFLNQSQLFEPLDSTFSRSVQNS